jgi:hypothetical protein
MKTVASEGLERGRTFQSVSLSKTLCRKYASNRDDFASKLHHAWPDKPSKKADHTSLLMFALIKS